MSDISRRDALKAFATVSFANFIDVGTPQLERTLRAVESLEQGQPYTPKFFSRHEWQTVRLLVDYVIPRDARSGSATEAKVPEFMDVLLADKDATEANKICMRGGLAWLDNECYERFGKTFVAATPTEQTGVLDDIAWPKKAKPEMSQGVAFFNMFRDMTASGFWSSKIGVADLQYMGNTMVPEWKGCPPDALKKLGVAASGD